MKRKLLSLALVLAIAMSLSISLPALAADEDSNTLGLPAGTYTYVDETPSAQSGSGLGEVQFNYLDCTLSWAFGAESGVETGKITLTGDYRRFFEGMYLADLPVTDWLGGNPKDTEGYAGNVAGGVEITLTNEGKISCIDVINPATRTIAILSQDITDSLLTIKGITRGQPNLLQSCITVVGSVNGLYLTTQGDVILDGITIGHDDDGVGLQGDKIGGDTFIVDTVLVDGTVEWHGLKGVITSMGGQEGILETTGKDINMTGGSNIGRVGRALTLSTGIDKGGDIKLGYYVSCDATRGGLLPNADTSTDSLAIATSGSIIAGLGDVEIGGNTNKAVLIDMIGDIQGNNVTINPIDWGEIADITMAIGDITATGDINITVADIYPGYTRDNLSQSSVGVIVSTGNTSIEGEMPEHVLGNLSAGGDINLTADNINSAMESITANGKVTLNIGSIMAIGSVSGSEVVENVTYMSETCSPSTAGITVNGNSVDFDAYMINGNTYLKLRDLAYALNGTSKQFNVTWDDTSTDVSLTSGEAYTANGTEMQSNHNTAAEGTMSLLSVGVNGNSTFVTAYNINGAYYFKLRDLGSAIDFGVTWDSTSHAVIIDTSTGYVSE